MREVPIICYVSDLRELECFRWKTTHTEKKEGHKFNNLALELIEQSQSFWKNLLSKQGTKDYIFSEYRGTEFVVFITQGIDGTSHIGFAFILEGTPRKWYNAMHLILGLGLLPCYYSNKELP